MNTNAIEEPEEPLKSNLAMTTKHHLIPARSKAGRSEAAKSRLKNNWKIANRLTIIGSMLFLAILLIESAPGVSSEPLKCYHCSSADNPECDEPFRASNSSKILTNCLQALDGKEPKVCRKVIQTIESKRVVIRSCGYIDDHEKEKKSMCYKRSGTFAVMMESCVCYTDLCNHSASLVPNQSLILFLFTVMAASSSFLILKPTANIKRSSQL